MPTSLQYSHDIYGNTLQHSQQVPYVGKYANILGTYSNDISIKYSLINFHLDSVNELLIFHATSSFGDS